MMQNAQPPLRSNDLLGTRHGAATSLARFVNSDGGLSELKAYHQFRAKRHDACEI